MLHRLVAPALEEQEPSELSGHRGDGVLVALRLMGSQRALEHGYTLLDATGSEKDLTEPYLGARSVGPVAGGDEDPDRLLEQVCRFVEPAAHDGEVSGTCERPTPLRFLSGEIGGPLERTLRLE